jgi:hypothetical protein
LRTIRKIRVFILKTNKTAVIRHFDTVKAIFKEPVAHYWSFGTGRWFIQMDF